MALSKKALKAIKKDFEAGLPMSELLQKHNVSRSAVDRHAKVNKWEKWNRFKTKKKPQVGRPSSYRHEYAKQATALCIAGYTDDEIADFFGVARGTLHNWKSQIPEFLDAIIAGRDKATAKVATSLYQRAVGYTHPETKVFCHNGQIVEHTVDKHYPPEPKALAMYLKAKKPKVWRDVQEQKIDLQSGDEQAKKLTIEFIEAESENENPTP